MNDRVVLITGASSGIGRALAQEYARRGARLALVARRRERLEDLANALGPRAVAVQGDVCRDGDLDRAVDEVLRAFGRIDVVVANAGFSVNGALDRITVDDYRRQLETNVFGVLRTIYATLDAVKASRGAYALVGSVSGFVSVPGYTAYSMSKYAVRALAEGLDVELRPHGVSVTHVAPGFVESEIRSVDNRGTYRAESADPVPSWIVVPSPKAAREIADAIDARRSEAVITRHGRVFAALSRHLPWLVHRTLGFGARFIPQIDQAGG
ncbi:MAG: SDR family NAD(P)-dependent oxidoreductase [Deltaproteobacteria bacterium]|nr:SDR family NAD(P)-dependent oxidoreductase [Deltaproteobacteria bacterium]